MATTDLTPSDSDHQVFQDDQSFQDDQVIEAISHLFVAHHREVDILRACVVDLSRGLRFSNDQVFRLHPCTQTPAHECVPPVVRPGLDACTQTPVHECVPPVVRPGLDACWHSYDASGKGLAPLLGCEGLAADSGVRGAAQVPEVPNANVVSVPAQQHGERRSGAGQGLTLNFGAPFAAQCSSVDSRSSPTHLESPVTPHHLMSTNPRGSSPTSGRFPSRSRDRPTWARRTVTVMMDSPLPPTWIEIMDVIIALAIVLNGVSIGLQTDYQARMLTESVPSQFTYAEIFFSVTFTIEIIIRLLLYRLKFFTMPGMSWNLFDLVLVLFSWVEIFGFLFTPHESESAPETSNFLFLRVLRVLRLLRVLRVMRLLQWFGQMTVVTEALAHSMSSLLTTAALLFVLVYCVAIVCTQAVFKHRITNKDINTSADVELRYWWGDLPRAILSLLEAVLAGADWDNSLKELFRVSMAVGMLFLAYTCFTLLAMMNVITGIFVQSALRHAEKSKDHAFADHVQRLFRMLDPNYGGCVSEAEYMMRIGSKELQGHMNDMDIDLKDATRLFKFLDRDNDGSINAEELLSGLLKLRSGAKYMDLMTLMHELSGHKHDFAQFAMTVEGSLQALTACIRRASERNGASKLSGTLSRQISNSQLSATSTELESARRRRWNSGQASRTS